MLHHAKLTMSRYTELDAEYDHQETSIGNAESTSLYRPTAVNY